ncbi:MAG: hypothetical protein ACRD1T_10670, partial [Acidimicrobiia bacterium]
MKVSILRRSARPLMLLVALVASLSLGSSIALAQPLPDLTPTNLRDFGITGRLGGPTLEFGILTANLGGQDYRRPRDPGTGQLILTRLYEWNVYKLVGEDLE